MVFDEVFFGGNRLQKDTINQLTASLVNGDRKIHCVVGGSRSGKSTAIQKTINNLIAQHDFSLLNDDTANQLWNGNKGRKELFNAISAVDNVPDLFQILRDNTHPTHYVLYVATEVILDEYQEKMERVLKAFQKVDANLSIIMDVPVLSLSLIPGQQSSMQGLHFQKHNQILKNFADRYPELKIYSLEYDLAQVKEQLWETRNDYDTRDFEIQLSLLSVDTDTPEWKKIFKILEKSIVGTPAQRKQYDLAFQRIVAQQIYGLPL